MTREQSTVKRRGSLPGCSTHSIAKLKFRKLAKLTQARYGTDRIPATIDLCQNVTIVAAIAAQRSSTSTKAGPGF